MKIDHAKKEISFRQSWLGTAMRCPEEGRLSALKDWDQTSDEAFIGTATHAGIEAIVNGATPVEAALAINAEYMHNPEAQDLVFTKRENIDECLRISQACFQGWYHDYHPFLVPGRAEVPFRQYVFTYRGWKVFIEGTIDFVPDEGNRLVDWKTGGSKYQQKAKQKWAVQPTVYSWVAALGGLGREFTWPMQFDFVVMVKTNNPYVDVVTVERNETHVEWLAHRMKTFIDLYAGIGLNTAWPQIDEGNYLCSKKWCAYYDICRGAFISMESDLFGYNPK